MTTQIQYSTKTTGNCDVNNNDDDDNDNDDDDARCLYCTHISCSTSSHLSFGCSFFSSVQHSRYSTTVTRTDGCLKIDWLLGSEHP